MEDVELVIGGYGVGVFFVIVRGEVLVNSLDGLYNLFGYFIWLDGYIVVSLCKGWSEFIVMVDMEC